MKKAFGVIEILIAFLLISLIIAGCMNMTLNQMQDGRLQHSKLEEAHQQADELIDNIQNIRERNLEYEEDLLDDYEDDDEEDE